LETVIGFFLLLMLFLGALRMFDAGLFYSAKAQKKAAAVAVAQRVLSEMKVYARSHTGSGLGFDDWSSWDGLDQLDSEAPEFRVRVTVKDQILKSPSTQLENSYPIANQKLLSDSYKTVEIRISWSEDSQNYTLPALIGEPTRPLPITVSVAPTSGSSPTLAQDSSAAFEATAFDADGTEVKDCAFQWEVKPGDTNGRMEAQRPTNTSTFTHQIAVPNMPNLYTTGPAAVRAYVTYHGTIYEGKSTPFTLLP
jgi:hypothetical protein